jgi:excisionase family DNA binding protein
MQEVMELMTIREVAKKLGVSENWVYSHLRVRKPLVPHVRLGGNIRFRESDIDRWIEEQVENAVRQGAA